ncbi:MAG: cytochrome c biogenesis protein, partial [Planctomycetota bacterium]
MSRFRMLSNLKSASAICLALATLLLTPELSGQAASGHGHRRTQPWNPELVEKVSQLAVQEHGRIKPLYTAASFLMLRVHQSRSMRVPDTPRFGAIAGEKLTPMTWAMDCLFYPEQAHEYPVFTIQNDEALTAIGLSHEGKRKRDRYSYEELRPALQQLAQRSQEYHRIDEKEQSDVQRQVLDLWRNVFEYRQLCSTLDFARKSFAANGRLAQLIPGKDPIRFSDVMSRGAEVRSMLAAADPEAHPEEDGLHQVQHGLNEIFGSGEFVALFPMPGKEQEEWLDVPQVVMQIQSPAGSPPAQVLHQLQLIESAVDAIHEPGVFEQTVGMWCDANKQQAEARNEYGKVSLEVSYHQGDYFYKSLLFFGGSFLLVLFSWLRPKNRVMPKLLWVGSSIGLGILVWGIVVRCILRSRPPVSTLYETILFITAVVVIVCLLMEWMNKRRIGMSMAVVLGFGGMLLAPAYETLDGEDTMPNLVAVLDTNFWLATHVTTVTMGYAAGLLAGFLAHFYIIGRMLGVRGGSYANYRNLGRMIYGVICFGLLFSILGTILGGVWANDSWGRFWGWDPKENGALMICLWNIMILHARLGGMIRDLGVAVLAVVGNTVVAFSWWHVNLLGVGLHSYGFTAGIFWSLIVFYSIEGLLVLG